MNLKEQFKSFLVLSFLPYLFLAVTMGVLPRHEMRVVFEFFLALVSALLLYVDKHRAGQNQAILFLYAKDGFLTACVGALLVAAGIFLRISPVIAFEYRVIVCWVMMSLGLGLVTGYAFYKGHELGSKTAKL